MAAKGSAWQEPVHGTTIWRKDVQKHIWEMSFDITLCIGCYTVPCTAKCHCMIVCAAVCLLNALLLLLNSDVALDFTACPAVNSR